jgi:FKBP-type peptidyl-prolyl cis-trans isomerase
MLEGETRELVVAGDLAYGPSGRGEIPPNATLIFTIELLKLTASQ